MIADFEKEVFARAAQEQPSANAQEVRELLCADARSLGACEGARHLLAIFAAVRHPMGYPTGATPEETARLNGQREVVAFLLRWGEFKPPAL